MHAHLSQFQPGFSRINVGMAAAILLELKYHGPLSLAWDDTALEPAFAVWEESRKNVCSILGASGSIIRVTAEDDLDAVFEQAKLAPQVTP